MGIDGFSDLIKKCPNPDKVKRVVPTEVFKGRRVAVDAGNIMVKTMINPWNQVVEKTKYPNDQPNMERFIQLWLDRLKRDLEFFLMAGITPVFVFDGKSPPEKAECRAERKERYDTNRKEYENLMAKCRTLSTEDRGSYIIEIKKRAKNMYPCNPDMIAIMKNFYTVLGIPIIQCNEEAERLCAQLCMYGYCSAVYTEDRDTLVHGCPLIINKIGGTMNYNNKLVSAIEIIDLYEIIRGLDITFQQFLDLCIMCGCDYNKRIKQIGPSRAYPMIVKYGNINKIPAADIQKFLLRHIKRNPNDSYMLANPKVCLQIESCYNRFAPINVEKLLSDEDIEDQILKKLYLGKIGLQAGEFLSLYKMDHIIANLVKYHAFHPQMQEKDGPTITPPNIIHTNWAKLIVGTSYIKLWGF